MDNYHTLVIGGGAAGFFSALSAKKNSPTKRVAIIEKNAALLSKVKISGGGRCNVTHSCFDPTLLVKNYPRGHRELLGPFHQFQPKDTIEWFENRSVLLKTESDGRMFPKSNTSETIINCLMNECEKLDVPILKKQKIASIEKKESGYELLMENGTALNCKKLILATGSAPAGHKWAKELGHTIIAPVPSLFTFNVPNSPLSELSGISLESATVKIKGSKLFQTGPLLITHFGFSGPAVLKLSAWAARVLHEKNYYFEIVINWLKDLSLDETQQKLITLKSSAPTKTIASENIFNFPKKLWKAFITRSNISETKRLNDLSTKEIQTLSQMLCADTFKVEGKTTNKEEFVTCGGVSLKEVNFKTMESKVSKGLYFAGEILDIDGITGGFNFQNAWTTGYIAGSASATEP